MAWSIRQKQHLGKTRFFVFFCSFKGKIRKWLGAFAKNSSMEKDGNLLFFGGLKVKNENGVEHSLKTASCNGTHFCCFLIFLGLSE